MSDIPENNYVPELRSEPSSPGGSIDWELAAELDRCESDDEFGNDEHGGERTPEAETETQEVHDDEGAAGDIEYEEEIDGYVEYQEEEDWAPRPLRRGEEGYETGSTTEASDAESEPAQAVVPPPSRPIRRSRPAFAFGRTSSLDNIDRSGPTSQCSIARKRSFRQISPASESSTSSSEGGSSGSESDHHDKENQDIDDSDVVETASGVRFRIIRRDNANKRVKQNDTPPTAEDATKTHVTLRAPPWKTNPDSYIRRLSAEDKIVTCTFGDCNLEYRATTKIMVIQHLEQHHAQILEALKGGSSCPMCPVEVTMTNLGRHLLEMHLKVPKFICLVCNERPVVRDRADMRKHVVACTQPFTEG